MSNPFYFGWACVSPDDASPPNFILTNSVRNDRSSSQAYLGEAWAHEDETPHQGWRRAYRWGWRCKRVAIRLASWDHSHD
jgi:hypothetical protein